LESDPTQGTGAVKALDRFALDRKIHAAGWNFFFNGRGSEGKLFSVRSRQKYQKALKRFV